MINGNDTDILISGAGINGVGIARDEARRLDEARSEAGLGSEIRPGLIEAEAKCLVQHEWACTAEDILCRRAKPGPRSTPSGVVCRERLANRMAA